MPEMFVDPELRPLLAAMPELELNNDTLDALRAAERAYPPVPQSATIKETRLIKGPDNSPDVNLVVYRPISQAEARPCILHMHGGGYVLGAAEDMEFIHRPLSEDLDCVIVSVDYRLAPETVYPGALEDCYCALQWLHSNAIELGIDAGRIGVMGESAGGGLAAALALLARDRGELKLSFQHLVYPMIDDRTGTPSDAKKLVGPYTWNAAHNQFGWQALLGYEAGGDNVSPYAAAARETDLSGLPATYLATSTRDLFLEENMDYAHRLMQAGVATELHVYPGGFHGFDILTKAAVAERALRDHKQALARALSRQPDD